MGPPETCRAGGKLPTRPGAQGCPAWSCLPGACPPPRACLDTGPPNSPGAPHEGSAPLHPKLRDKRLGAWFPDARHGVAHVDGVSARGWALLDRLPAVGLPPGQGRFEVVRLRQQRPHHPPWGVCQAAVERAATDAPRIARSLPARALATRDAPSGAAWLWRSEPGAHWRGRGSVRAGHGEGRGRHLAFSHPWRSRAATQARARASVLSPGPLAHGGR